MIEIKQWFADRFRKKTSWLIVAFVVLAIWGGCQMAEAQEAGIGIGFGATNGNNWTGQQIFVSNGTWYGSFMRVDGDDTLPQTNRYSIGYRISWRQQTRFTPYLKIGAAYFEHDITPLISDRWAYDMAVGARLWRVADIEWQHNSTAGRSDFNDGVDMPFLFLTFQFDD